MQESPSDKFQVSRLNERTVLPPLYVGEKKKRLITRIHVILKREIHRQPGRPDYGWPDYDSCV